MLTHEQIAAIEAREQAATKQKWGVYRRPCGCYDVIIPAVYDNKPCDISLVSKIRGGSHDEGPHIDQNNADFIAHARQDIPALLADRRELVAEVERLREALGEYANELNWTKPLYGKLLNLFSCGPLGRGYDIARAALAHRQEGKP